MTDPQKYVVVLAHADGWGASSANQLIRHLHEQYPDLDVYLVVSQATKNKDGEIATQLDDLKPPRQLKEKELGEYFRRIDEVCDTTPSYEQTFDMLNQQQKPEGVAEADLPEYFMRLGMRQTQILSTEQLTFKQLAKRYCVDGEVHFTSRGGPVGGEEVEKFVAELEKKHGHGPEVLLSVDTMAILPKPLLERYRSFSTHPGPLDRIKIEGMQGTLRAMVNQVLYDNKGKPLPAEHIFGTGFTNLKGTLFMQHPDGLDKGPIIDNVLSPVCPGVCAYQAREDLYYLLVNKMIRRLPEFLDKGKREKLVERAMRNKAVLDKKPAQHVEKLDAEKFATWQRHAIGFADESEPWGVYVAQNEIVNPLHFRNQMRRYFPGTDAEFKRNFKEVYGDTLDKLAAQKKSRLTDKTARLLSGDRNMHYDPKTGEITEKPNRCR